MTLSCSMRNSSAESLTSAAVPLTPIWRPFRRRAFSSSNCRILSKFSTAGGKTVFPFTNPECKSESGLPCVKVKPTKGRCSPLKAALAWGGTASDIRMSVSSTSKLEVSVGLDTSGMYGALLSRNPSQSMLTNQGWLCKNGSTWLVLLSVQQRLKIYLKIANAVLPQPVVGSANQFSHQIFSIIGNFTATISRQIKAVLL